MRLLFWIAIAIAALALASFAASNRDPVALGLWPLGVFLQVPLYAAILATFLLGLLCGALGAWLAGRRRRREARQRGRRITALEHELAATQAQLPGSAPPASLPAGSVAAGSVAVRG